MSKTIGMISLGCPKNQVDAELMLAKLQNAGYEITDDPMTADAVIVNTCGFIDEAKKEAIDNILEMAEYKKYGDLKHIIVTGCLAERFKDEVAEEFPEVDAVLGIGANGDIVALCDEVLGGGRPVLFPDKCSLPLEGQRTLTTPSYTAYLKIADGCSNCCSYCAIPKIRGKYRSRPMESVIEEAKQLAEAGVKELTLIAQDTTKYGFDLYGELKLPELLHKLGEIEGIRWLRLLYCYPDSITDELLEEMKNNEKVCRYIDLPLQHCNERVLKNMNRSGSKAELAALIEKIRSFMPDAVIRTTLITGFPGETEEEFEELCDFVKEVRFDRLGCFAYSREEGTKAAEMPNQIDEQVKADRGDLIMQLQNRIFTEKQEEKIGSVLTVLTEGYDDYTDCYYGRSEGDAFEIDSLVYFTSPVDIEDGEFVKVKIRGVHEIDLTGECLDIE